MSEPNVHSICSSLQTLISEIFKEKIEIGLDLENLHLKWIMDKSYSSTTYSTNIWLLGQVRLKYYTVPFNEKHFSDSNMMSDKEERHEKKQRKDSSSPSSSSMSSSSSSYSSDSDSGDKTAKKSSKYDKNEETKSFKRREEKRTSPDKREVVKPHYSHRSRHKERDRKRERTRSRSRDRKRERSYRRSRSPGNRHSSSRHARKDHEHVRRRIRSRSRSFDRSTSRKSYNKSLKKLNMLEKLGIELKVPDGQPTAAQSTQLPGGITIPSYYNPSGVNPLKYVQQMQKRKLLWGNSQKQTAQTSSEKVEEKHPIGPETVWKGTSFSNDQDGKLTAKFKRLMGIKSSEDEKTSEGSGSTLIKKQEEIFESMEKQYEVARVATHTHRGLGLGFGVHQPR